MPIHHEIESPIFYDQQIELDQFHTFESPFDKLASSHFYEIELNKKCDLDSQFCDLVQIPESILTPVLLPDLSNILESVLIPTAVIFFPLFIAIMCGLICITAVFMIIMLPIYSLFRLQFRLSAYTWGIIPRVYASP